MESPLKLISSNIRFANPADGTHDWPFRKELLQEIYLSFGPDILGTQEGRKTQIYELLSGLKNLNLSDTHRNWITERMYPCLFFNPKTIDVEESGDIWLSETPGIPGSSSFESTFPRLCTWALVTIRASQKKIMVINTHLDHVLQSTRTEQLKVLIAEIEKRHENRPVILMGDFNESPLTELKSLVSDSLSLKDPWNELNLAEEPSHHGFKGESVIGDRIDWILIPKSFKTIEIKLFKQSFEGGIYPSDHYPLLATVIPR